MSPRRPQLTHDTAVALAVTEYDRCQQVLGSFSPGDWDAATDCPDWSVRDMACHMLGMIEMAASIRESVRVQREVNRAGGNPVDAMTALQVNERRDWTPSRIVETFATRAPEAASGRRSKPALIRRIPMPAQQVNGTSERWTLGYLMDVIFTRDSWMHRIDLSRATGRDPVLTADHDGAIVADVVAEWLTRHGRPVTLTLDGPAGGRWQQGAGGPTSSHDAVEFCRALSGRPSPVSHADLLETEVPF